MRIDGLELLREGVEQAPDGTGSEFLMKRLPPVPDDFRQNGRRDSPTVDRANQKIMSSLVGQSLLFVGGDPFVFTMKENIAVILRLEQRRMIQEIELLVIMKSGIGAPIFTCQ